MVQNDCQQPSVAGTAWRAYGTNGAIADPGPIRHTRHQARASSSVLPETSCSSGECSVTTQPAWSTSHQQEPPRMVIAARNASCRARHSSGGSIPACHAPASIAVGSGPSATACRSARPSWHRGELTSQLGQGLALPGRSHLVRRPGGVGPTGSTPKDRRARWRIPGRRHIARRRTGRRCCRSEDPGTCRDPSRSSRRRTRSLARSSGSRSSPAG
jgi:hypothetical protein